MNDTVNLNIPTNPAERTGKSMLMGTLRELNSGIISMAQARDAIWEWHTASRATPAAPPLDPATVEICAGIAMQIAINAERRAAGHTNLEAKQSALDKMQAAQEVAHSIRALANGKTK